MIDRYTTRLACGYDPYDLSRGSHKLVWRICDDCGEGRWLAYRDCHDLCRSCTMKTPEHLDKISGKNHHMWGKNHTDKTRQKMSNSLRGENNPFYGKHHTEATKTILCAINTGKVLSEKHKQKLAISGIGRKHTEATLTKMRDNSFWRGKNLPIETRIKISENHADVSGINNPNHGLTRSKETRIKISCTKRNISIEYFDQFTTFEPYCEKFNNEFKETIRDAFYRTCLICGKSEAENGLKLSVHHVDYNKKCGCDGNACVCVPLCQSCHGKTSNGDRAYWEKHIIELLGDRI